MRQTLSKGMVVAAAAATGVLSLYGTAALADSNAQSLAQGSPGVLSGNSIQVPVHVPVNVCGNSVDVAALLNPAFGNSCANVGHSVTPRPTGYGNDAYGHDVYGHDDPTPTPTSYGHDDPTPPVSYGKPDPTPTPTSYGHDDPTPPSYGSPEPTPTPTSYGSDEPTPTPTSYGSDEPTPLSSYGSDEPTPPSSYGSDEPTPPGSYGNDEPPTLPHTGGNAKAMIATSAASAALIMAGAVLYRRGRTAARR
ncbi:chaplin family protein [Streptomyces sp. LaBMicrA B280]|uniref:chaplin n=1 Tax=Streptomyces sp. LaBMicrA B280 TaxID=3391001 RepID=UPI003BA80FD2